jgi:hypothetical protein
MTIANVVYILPVFYHLESIPWVQFGVLINPLAVTTYQSRYRLSDSRKQVAWIVNTSMSQLFAQHMGELTSKLVI